MSLYIYLTVGLLLQGRDILLEPVCTKFNLYLCQYLLSPYPAPTPPTFTLRHQLFNEYVMSVDFIQ